MLTVQNWARFGRMNACIRRDGESPIAKENPSSSAHPVSVTHKVLVRLPTFIPVVLSLVGLDKVEKAIDLESCTA